MQFRQGVEIIGDDNRSVGHLDRVVLDPETLEVTHLIIRKGLLLTHNRVLPVDRVVSADPEQIKLVISAEQVEELPELDEQVYVPVSEADRGRVNKKYVEAPLPASFYWYPLATFPAPAVPIPPPDYVVETHRNIPEETVALKTGARVLDSDGKHVGDVEEVLTDETHDDKVTNFVLSQGIFLKERKRVPVAWVDDVTDEEVHLNTRASKIKSLPAFEPAHH